MRPDEPEVGSFGLLDKSSSCCWRFNRFSFFIRRLAFANQVLIWVKFILVAELSMIFSPLLGYGFSRCRSSHCLSTAVDSRVAFFRRATTVVWRPANEASNLAGCVTLRPHPAARCRPLAATNFAICCLAVSTMLARSRLVAWCQ